jgi:hypothetical protein
MPEMFKELLDKLGVEIVHGEIGALFSALLDGELKQKLQSVPVG